jgi:hypothetical protein
VRIKKILATSLLSGLSGALIMILSSCSSHKAEDYSNNTPLLTIQDYFNGPATAEGMLQNWRGKQTRRFSVMMQGTWQSNTEGTLHEEFVFDDGEKQTRDWHLKILDPHHFTATAHDVVGIARGEQYGNTIHMNYVLSVPVNGKQVNISIDDWLYAINKQTVINKSTLSKFGLNVGYLTIAFHKK